MKANAILKEIKSDNITETINQLKHVSSLWEKSRSQTKPKKRKCSESTLVEKKIITVNIRVTEKY